MDLSIRAAGLVKRYGDVVAVDGLDLEVRTGECFGLLGPNGAGKTTTCEVLEGLIEPTAGTVEVLGLQWQTSEHALRARIGVALQETQLADKLSVRETLGLFRTFFPRPRAVDDVIAAVQLGEKRDAWVSKLSGGQRQRLAIACALIGDPDLMFLDEPTAGLDPQSRRSLWELVVDFRAGGGTVLLTTHYMDEAERLCDRVAIIDHGKVIALGTPAALVASLGGEHVIELAVEPALAPDDLAGVAAVVAARAAADGLSLKVSEPHVALPALIARLGELGARLTRLTTRHTTLEDVFVELTGRQLRDD